MPGCSELKPRFLNLQEERIEMGEVSHARNEFKEVQVIVTALIEARVLQQLIEQ
jgi:hypothetical protein